MRIKNPTLRKLRNRGLTPIRYRYHSGGGKHYREEARHGYIVSKNEKFWLVRLIGEESNRRVPIAETRYIKELA